MSGIDWGTVPDWLAGGGAVVALLFAGVAARAALRANGQQSRQLVNLEEQQRERNEREKRSQAALIAAWIQPDGEGLLQVYFINGSPLPIYRLRVILHVASETFAVEYAVRGPDSAPVKIMRATTKFRAVLDARQIMKWRKMLGDGRISVSMSFMDANSTRWNRDSSGLLSLDTSDQSSTIDGAQSE
ncbi:hypothetical protein GCM10010464_35800 [Pseudonocardia yunnanensis]|uniref:Uncharacterized protein n=1 Tax=Pseudonocardia yunnanensis TaxID=58107 RepID=A0ABW4EQ96_9PSEU